MTKIYKLDNASIDVSKIGDTELAWVTAMANKTNSFVSNSQKNNCKVCRELINDHYPEQLI